MEKALRPEIWPLRVKVREYIYYSKKKSKQQEGQKGDKVQTGQENQNEQPNQQLEVPQSVQQQPATQVSGISTFNRYGALAQLGAKPGL